MPPAHEAPPAAVTRQIGFSEPLAWLKYGMRDLAHSPGPSILHGLLILGIGAIVLLVAKQLPIVFLGAISGFALVGPALATGLCELSRRRETNQTVTIADAFTVWGRNPAGLAGFAVFALLAGTAWQIISMVLVAVLYKGQALTPQEFALDVLRDPANTLFFYAYVFIGGIMAAIVFAVSVIAVPMLVDRDCTWLDAMQASISAVAENPLPLALWATLIMLLVGLGFATALVGFVVIMPVLGHATWHAYRALLPA